mmetsp:Transcript_1886/g.4408  ORF Transcript_1886/g.4408 Transcript_1886/m.4408 type:complete len:284 (+) Transcript_1886:41-892(+)
MGTPDGSPSGKATGSPRPMHPDAFGKLVESIETMLKPPELADPIRFTFNDQINFRLRADLPQIFCLPVPCRECRIQVKVERDPLTPRALITLCGGMDNPKVRLHTADLDMLGEEDGKGGVVLDFEPEGSTSRRFAHFCAESSTGGKFCLRALRMSTRAALLQSQAAKRTAFEGRIQTLRDDFVQRAQFEEKLAELQGPGPGREKVDENKAKCLEWHPPKRVVSLVQKAAQKEQHRQEVLLRRDQRDLFRANRMQERLRSLQSVGEKALGDSWRWPARGPVSAR